MTVTELLAAMGAAYPGATEAALVVMKSAYYARLRGREGEALHAAWEAVVAEFRATMRQPFPLVADFEAHLPAGAHASSGPPIKAELEARDARRRANYEHWHGHQGAHIREHRPDAVYRACSLMAMAHCGSADWRHLSAEQIALAEKRALSQERLDRFGRLPRDARTWWAQLSEISGEWGIALDCHDWQTRERTREAA